MSSQSPLNHSSANVIAIAARTMNEARIKIRMNPWSSVPGIMLCESTAVSCPLA